MKKIKLGDACEILNGFAFKSENYVGSGIRVIRISNVQKGYIEDNTPAFYPLETKGLEKYMLEEGDLLISLTGNVGRVAILEKEFMPAALNQRVACLRLKTDKLSKRYLFHILNSDFFEKQCIQYSKGVAQKNMNTAWLKDYEILLYSKEQQELIADILDKMRLIKKSRYYELQKLDELVKARFVEMFGTIRENSHNYPRVTLKEVCHKITDRKHGGCKQEDNSGYYYVGAREIYDGKIHYDTAPQITYDDFSKDYRRCNLEKGDMVIVNTGATIGKSAIASSHLTEKTLLQKSVALIKVNSDIIIAEFLRYCYMVNPSMYMVKSASAQPNLMLSKMNSTIVYLPPIGLQRQFASFVEEVDKSQFVLHQ